MKKSYLFYAQVIVIGLILTGCQNQAPAPQAIVAEPSVVVSEAEPTDEINEPEPTATPPPPTPEPTAPPTATSTPTTKQTPTVTPVGDTTPEEYDLSPPEILFEYYWDEYAVFAKGLVESEHDVLDKLEGTTVYHMDITFSPDMQQVQGAEDILYTNQEDVPLNEIYLRLFPNLAGGSTIIEYVTVNDKLVEPVYELEDSALRLDLEQPLEPGGQVTIFIEFVVEIPNTDGGNYGTFAYQDDILAMAHFYPMIAVYDDEGWNVEIAPSIGDVVYADSSLYLVRVTAPREQVIVTSGVDIKQDKFGEHQSIIIAAGPMRDFYLAASDRFERTSTIVGETTINSYAPPEFEAGSELALQFAADAIESFNQHFGVYPFTEFDLLPIHTGALGIEYPGITAILIDLYDPDIRFGNTPSKVWLESTVVHEVAHQWFYSVIGNDQIDEPWLDEALAQFATYLYYVDVYGVSGANGFYQSLEGRWNRVERAQIPIGMPVRDYSPQEYGAIVYGRGPLFIEALSQALGPEVFAAFIKDYYETYQWQIATGPEFQALAEQHCDCDLSELFAEWVYVEPQ